MLRGRRQQRPFRIIGLDRKNSLWRGLVSYVRFGQAECGLNFSIDWAQSEAPVLVDLNLRETDAVTGYLGSYAASPNSNAFNYPARWRNPSPGGYTHLTIFQANSNPLNVSWRQWRPGDTSDTTGILWDHPNSTFRGGSFHQNSTGTYTPVTLSSPPLNTWIFAVARWDGTTIELWQDAVLVDSGSTNGTIQPFAGNTLSVQSDDGNGWKFATVAFWERALTDKEIWRLYDPSTRWEFEVAAPVTQFIGMPGTGPPPSTIPQLDEGQLTGGVLPMGGGMDSI